MGALTEDAGGVAGRRRPGTEDLFVPGRPPFFAFYPADFAGDLNVEAMTTLEVGAYILLLCKAWQADPPASLPNDDAVLARLARLTPGEWSAAKSGVLSPFVLGADNRWHQKRLRKEYETAKAKSKKRSVAGASGAAARWQSDAIAMRLPCASDGKPLSGSCSGSESSSSPEGVGGVGGGGGPAPPAAAVEIAAEWAFLSTRRRGGVKQDTPQDVVGDFAEMLRLGANPEALLAAVKDPARDRGEYLWQFRKRMFPPPHAGNGKAAGPGSVRSRMAELESRKKQERRAANG